MHSAREPLHVAEARALVGQRAARSSSGHGPRSTFNDRLTAQPSPFPVASTSVCVTFARENTHTLLFAVTQNHHSHSFPFPFLFLLFHFQKHSPSKARARAPRKIPTHERVFCLSLSLSLSLPRRAQSQHRVASSRTDPAHPNYQLSSVCVWLEPEPFLSLSISPRLSLSRSAAVAAPADSLPGTWSRALLDPFFFFFPSPSWLPTQIHALAGVLAPPSS